MTPEPVQNRRNVANGSAMAAFLGAGIGAFAVGAFALMNEAGLLVAPTLYGPAGGISGRTTLATLAWLIAWGGLHRRWRTREVDSRRVYLVTLALVGLGILGTFPPIWALF